MVRDIEVLKVRWVGGGVGGGRGRGEGEGFTLVVRHRVSGQ